MEIKMTKGNMVLIVIFLILVFVGISIYEERNNVKPLAENNNITLVEDYGRFFSISNAANKYINYLNKQNIGNLMILLDINYKNKNNITNENLLHNLSLLDTKKEYNFGAQKMYQEDLSKNIIRYYIYGYLSEIAMENIVGYQDYYLIIDLNTENMLFSITPYDGKIFKEDTK